MSQLARGLQPTLEVDARGEIQRTKWSVGGREGKEPGVHLVAVLSSSSSIFGGLRSPGKHRHEAYIVPHYHIYCS